MAKTKHNLILGNHENPNDKNVLPSRIKGFGKTKTISVSTSSSDTDELFVEGLSHGCIYNGSVNQITITWNQPAGMISGSTGSPLKDQDDSAVTSIVDALGTKELPTSIAGLKYLLPVSSIASTEITIHMER